MDEQGFVHLPDGPGLGFDFNWNYINDNLIGSSIGGAADGRQVLP
jgi:hypothetical protein